MKTNEIINQLGGTKAVADLCHVTKGAVSQWRIEGIPSARLMYLKILRPDVFDTLLCSESKPVKEAA